MLGVSGAARCGVDGEFGGRGLVLRVAGIMAEENLGEIVDAIAIGVLAGEQRETRGKVGALALGAEAFAEFAQAIAKGIVWKFFEALGGSFVAGKMARRAVVERGREERIEMLREGDFVGRRRKRGGDAEDGEEQGTTDSHG